MNDWIDIYSQSEDHMYDKTDILNWIINIQNELNIVTNNIKQIKENCDNLGYVYIGKDVSNPNDTIKIGSTTDLADRLISFRTGQPDFYYLVIIELRGYRELESELKQIYEEYKYEGENFKNLNIHDVCRWLKNHKYKKCHDNIYRHT